MVTCNLHFDMELQWCIGDVQIAVYMLHYVLLQCNNGDLQFALCKLHVSVLHYSTLNLYFENYILLHFCAPV